MCLEVKKKKKPIPTSQNGSKWQKKKKEKKKNNNFKQSDEYQLRWEKDYLPPPFRTNIVT